MVNAIRYQLKSKSINDSWQEIVKLGNTQKLVTTGRISNFRSIKPLFCKTPFW